MNKIKLSAIDKQLKIFLVIYLVTVMVGVSVGIIYLSQTTSLTPKGTVERFNGSEMEMNNLEVPESFPKPISELLISTHNHILGLSFIFFSVGLIFYFTSIVKGTIKTILMVEPMVSITITFGSIWLVRFIYPGFVYLTFVSSFLMYTGFYTIIFISLYELLIKKKGSRV